MNTRFALLLSLTALGAVSLTHGAAPAGPDLSANLAAHYTFDGNFNDSSANGFHGTAVGAPGFGLGQVGSGALRVNSAQDGSSFNYVTAGTAPVASMAEGDFTVSFWVQYSNAIGDPPFVSNKDWNSGNNVGVVIADGGSGVMKHNIRGTGGSRVDGNFARTRDGLWHHVVTVYERSGPNTATLYLDGVALATNSLANLAGSIHSGLPLNIGQDGTGLYTDSYRVGITNGLIDDVAVWSRALPQNEVEFIFQEGQAGRSFDGISTFPPVVLIPPQSTNVPYQGTLMLSAVVGGTAPLSYQWYHDVDVLPDQTNAVLVLNNVGEFDGGPYHLEVSNAVGGPVASAEAWVTVLFTIDPPVITQSPQAVTINESLDVTFNVVATGEFLHYQWQRADADIAGATNSTLSLPTVSPAQAGVYTVIVTNFGGAVTSAPALLTINSEGPTVITGQWDFQEGDLAATCGQPLEPFDATVNNDTAFGTTTSFGIPDIAGQPAHVLRYTPSVATWGGYKMIHGAAPNGGGAYVNKYTIIYDLLYPPASDLTWRSLLQTSTTDGNDGDFFINTANGIGISGVYPGNVTANQWHRLVLAVDLSVPVVTKYLDGVRVANQTLGAGIDGRWSLDTFALLFADEDGETHQGYVSSVQFRNGKITDAEVAALGTPTATKIPGCGTIPHVSIIMEAGQILIQHPGAGLEEADNVEGPYTEIVGAPDPYVVPAPLPAKKFYRPKR
jgi:hypothetical protein